MKNRRNLFVTILIAAVIVTVALVAGTVSVSAKEEGTTVKYFENIEIQPCDTLWSISETYRAGSGLNANEYIDELKKINGLSSDLIKAGNHLVVVRYRSSN